MYLMSHSLSLQGRNSNQAWGLQNSALNHHNLGNVPRGMPSKARASWDKEIALGFK
jgi:hypothetical protein